jgi:hypothetical protein
MKSIAYSVCVLAVTLTALPLAVRAQKPTYFPNAHFARQIGSVAPMLWKDFEAIQNNYYKCIEDKKTETVLCKQVRERYSDAVYNAFVLAHIHNATAKLGEPVFCDATGEKSIVDRDFRGVVVYGVLLINERLKYGSSLYGQSLPNTYLAKIFHDSLIDTQPCKR